MSENEDYTNALLDIIVKRGVPAMYRDSDGYLKIIAKEDLLNVASGALNDLIPQPLTFDSNGRVKVNADIQVEDIEIGAVEFKDADTDIRVKVDNDHAARVGVYDTSGVRINPAKDENLQKIRAVMNNLAIEREDIYVETQNSEIVSDEDFLVSYKSLKIEPYGASVSFDGYDINLPVPKISISFLKPVYASSLVVIAKDFSDLSNIQLGLYFFNDVNGYTSAVSKPLSDINNGYLQLDISDRQRRLVGITIENKSKDSQSGVLGIVIMSRINGVEPIPNILSYVKSVGTSASAIIGSDYFIRDEVILSADEKNTDSIFVGGSSSQNYELKAGDTITLKKVRLSDVYVKSANGTQNLVVISGGGA